MKNLCKLTMSLTIAFVASTVWSANVRITQAPSFKDSEASGTALINFGLAWDLSWRTKDTTVQQNDPYNWDAVWVFCKYQFEEGAWDHMYLDDSYMPQVDSTGGVDMAYSYGKTGDKTVGVFLYRATDGHGTVSWKDITLRWKYDEPNGYLNKTTLYTREGITIKLFAIEMVYVPQHRFYLGSGDTMPGEFRKGGTKEPYMVTGEGPITMGEGGLDYANYNNFYLDSLRTNSTIPAEFPKGFKAFYCMKYEISQGAYVDFLNTLTLIQQTARTRQSPLAGVGMRVMIQTDVNDRNYIKIKKNGKTAEYCCDMDNDNIMDETSDGRWVACAMNHADLSAYLDFCGLRPMTELEFEKACRGTFIPIPAEFAWGHTAFYTSSTFSNPGTISERPATYYGNVMVAGKQNITRNGAFGTWYSGRFVAGATYYGIMEMSGNLWENTISIYNMEGRAFTGNHGDGRLTDEGAHNTLNWPNYRGFGLRGGAVDENFRIGSSHAVSNRNSPFFDSNPGNYWAVGGRGVRTAE